MNKSSTVTVRETPVTDVSKATAGGLTIHGESIVVQTNQRIDVVDLTEAFGITKPGEYWVFRGGALEGNAPLRFEMTDKLRKGGE